MSTQPAAVIAKCASDGRGREWVSGFVLVGVLVGLLGSLLITWQYHIDTDPQLIGLHFLALNAGYVIAVSISQRLLLRMPMRSLALAACATAFLSLAALSFLAPPLFTVWRLVTLGFVGCAGGALVSALLYVIEPYFAEAPAAVANQAGVLFGCGCLMATLTGAMTYFAGSGPQTALLAIVPLIYLVIYARNRSPGARAVVQRRREDAEAREMLRDLRSIAAVLFSLLLFFQFGNEWAIAGWLPLFLIHRFGSNPVWAIFGLAIYFLALMAGRLAVQPLLSRVNHRKLLLASMMAAMTGYLLLSFTGSMSGAWAAVVVIGAGFAPIYPLVAENLDDRFSYHPGFYNGIFSIAITGAMSAPWLLGYVAEYLGIRYVMLIPALGSIAVFVLALLIMFEAHVMGRANTGTASSATAGGNL